ncbi:serine/threonine-protein kinase [Dactylosporangium sp. NPDC000244]|uniref:serine/threonine-protein kinase n=1 Tax=Dactylosporangium sp. NPDC000244 TaxID=3154365 RepID=UPI0033202A0D
MSGSGAGDEPRVLGGRYRLDDILGVGGMSVVWLAHDSVLGRSVAVKVLSGRYAADERSRRRIRDEARAAAVLSHPNIAQVYDYGEAFPGDDKAPATGETPHAGRPSGNETPQAGRPSGNETPQAGRAAGNEARQAAGGPTGSETPSGGATTGDGPMPYVVMELVPGQTLAQRLAEGPLPPAESLRICAEAAAGLAAAHAEGLVHRDVKPANVILSPAGAKLVDFGIATLVGPEALTDTDASGRPVFGTPQYLAPERLGSDPVTAASDVYSLGVVLYKLLAGTLPWPVADGPDVLDAHQHRVPAPLPRLPGVPPAVADLCRRCLAKHPRSRPSAAEVAAVLRATAEPRPSRIRDTAWPAVAAAGGATAAVVLAWVLVSAPDHAVPADVQPWLADPTVSPVVASRSDNSSGAAANPGTAATEKGPGVAGNGGGTAVATSGAAPGPTGGATGGVTTTDPATPPPTERPPASRTFTSEGGAVTAECADGLARITDRTPAKSWKVDDEQTGPAAAASVTFRHGNTRVTMTVTCPGGTPSLSTDTA